MKDMPLISCHLLGLQGLPLGRRILYLDATMYHKNISSKLKLKTHLATCQDKHCLQSSELHHPNLRSSEKSSDFHTNAEDDMEYWPNIHISHLPQRLALIFDMLQTEPSKTIKTLFQLTRYFIQIYSVFLNSGKNFRDVKSDKISKTYREREDHPTMVHIIKRFSMIKVEKKKRKCDENTKTETYVKWFNNSAGINSEKKKYCILKDSWLGHHVHTYSQCPVYLFLNLQIKKSTHTGRTRKLSQIDGVQTRDV